MEKNKTVAESCFRHLLIECTLIIAIYFCGALFSYYNNFMSFFWLSLGGIGIFLYFSFREKNLLDMRGVLIGVMTVSVGISQLRLSAIQGPWEVLTWFCHGAGYVTFCIGFFLFKQYGMQKLSKISLPKKIGRFSYFFQPKKIYYTTIFLAVMPLVLFCIQVAIKGFIPIFVQRYDAYILFYTRLSIFINLVILAAPLAFWCLRNMELKTYQKVLMYAIIPLPTIIFQLMVQRGLFVWSVCILLVMVYFEGKNKFLGVFAVVMLMIGGVLFSSAMRNIPLDAMQDLWQIDGEIVVDGSNNDNHLGNGFEGITGDSSGKEDGATGDSSGKEDGATGDSSDKTENGTSITLPGFLYAPYYYVVSGIENFNNTVVNLEKHSYGLLQLTPFTVILRFPGLKNAISSFPLYRQLPNSTFCLITDFYYDFGPIGVVVEMLLLGAISAAVQILYCKKRRPCAGLTYGVFMSVYITSFFASWFSVFGTWLFWGTALLIFLFAYFKLTPKKT